MTNANTISLRPKPIAVDAVMLFTLASLAVVAANSAIAAQQPALMGTAILIDLTLTAAFAHYILGVRWAGLPLWTLVPVAASGYLLSMVALPERLTPSGALPLAIVSVVELSVLSLALFRFRTLWGAFKQARTDGGNRFDALEAGFFALTPAVPLASRWIRLEAELWWFAATGWVRRSHTGADVFTHHLDTNWTPIALVFAFLSIIEGSLVHWFLISNAWVGAAFVAAGVHVYGLAWILGDMHAVRLRPSKIVDDKFELSVGLRARAHIDLANIEDAAVGEWEPDVIEAEAGSARLFGPATLRLQLREPLKLSRVLGTKEVRVLYIQVDAPAAVAAALMRRTTTTEETPPV